MSHTANLRHRQQQQQAALLPQKRPRPYTNSNGNGIGLQNGTRPSSSMTAVFEASPIQDAKRKVKLDAIRKPQHISVTQGGNDVDLHHLANGTANDTADFSGEDADQDGDSDSDIAEDDDQHQPQDPSIPNDQDEDLEPSFGDLLLARSERGEAPTIEINADSNIASTQQIIPRDERSLAIPSANSLGTVLSQALKTNDVDLLESCLQVPNLDSIRATIERLHSTQAAVLLQKLAERMHRRPGRAGSLMIWVQWTVVSHGGHLAASPDATKNLLSLYRVVKQRSTALHPLLALKGKLDMLEAQIQLRRNRQARARNGNLEQNRSRPVIYVEGESDLEEQVTEKNPLATTNGSDDENDISVPNGIDSDSAEGDAESVDDSSEDDDNLIDDEAEESGDEDDGLSSDEVDLEDEMDQDDDRDNSSQSEEEQRPKKLFKASSAK